MDLHYLLYQRSTDARLLRNNELRTKAASEVKKLGCSEGQIQVALAHTDSLTPWDYIRGQKAPVSEVILKTEVESFAKKYLARPLILR